MEYQVTIKEILSRVLRIDSSSAEEAEERVRDLYRKEQIVLDYSDFSYYDIYTDVNDKKNLPCYSSANLDFTILQGNCMDRLKEIEDNSIDAIFADPPYFLSNGGISVHSGKQVCVDKGQ